jgi:hypothetical protein
MRKYNFMGKDTSEEEFWMLCSMNKIEEINNKINGEIDQKKVNELLEEFKVKPNEINTPKCDSCGSKMILNNANWGKYWHCSNIMDCISIRLI